MPLDTQTLNLQAELDRLTDEVEEKADEVAELPAGSPGAQQAAQDGQQADNFRAGIYWALEVAPDDNTFTLWDSAPESVTVAAHNVGEADFVGEIADELDTYGAYKKVYVAVGTRDAPYLKHDPEKVPMNKAAVQQTVSALNDLHPQFRNYLETQISEIANFGSDLGNSFQELVQEKRRQASYQTESGETTAE